MKIWKSLCGKNNEQLNYFMVKNTLNIFEYVWKYMFYYQDGTVVQW